MGAERARRPRGLSGARLLQVQRALRVGGGGGRGGGSAGGGGSDSSDDEGPGAAPATSGMRAAASPAAALGWSSDEEDEEENVGGGHGHAQASVSAFGTPLSSGDASVIVSARRALRTPHGGGGHPARASSPAAWGLAAAPGAPAPFSEVRGGLSTPAPPSGGVGWEGREDRARAAVRSAEAAVSEAAARPEEGVGAAGGALRRELEAALEKYGASEQGRRQEVLALRAQLHRVQCEAVAEQRSLRQRALAAEAEAVQLRVQLERVLAQQAVEVAEKVREVGGASETAAMDEVEWQRERDLARLARLVGKLQRDLEEARLQVLAVAGGGSPSVGGVIPDTVPPAQKFFGGENTPLDKDRAEGAPVPGPGGPAIPPL